MKPFFVVLALTLAAAMAVPSASGVGVPPLGPAPSMIEKVEGKAPPKRRKSQCYNKCVEESGCAGDIIGQCYAYCSCICNSRTSKKAKRCPDPT